MESGAHKILINIASVSQRLVNILDRCVGYKTAESFRLEKLVVGSCTVLEVLSETSLLNDGHTDDRLLDWLKSEEPQACLQTLNQMEEMLARKVEYSVKNFFKASHSENKNSEAIRLFQMRKSFFHFLLTADIWNREGDAQQQPRSTAQPGSLYVNQALQDGQFLGPCDHDGAGVVRTSRTSATERRKGIDLKKLDGILGWLDARSSRAMHERIILLCQPDTCTWLPNTHQFKKWRSTDDSLLWLHGKPGAGKSVLTASVIEGLKSTIQDGEVLLFFYCDFRNERSTSAAEVFRSILSQLLQQIRRRADDPGDLIDDLVEERDGGASTLNNVVLLARHVSRAAKQFSQQPLLVIDALDECKDIECLLDALLELCKGGIRVFVTSRPLQVVKDTFTRFPSISMDVMQHAVSADIKLHARRELDSHRRLRILDDILKNEIYSALCAKADGMFRWVQCQLDTLKQCVTTERIRKALKNLPRDLNGTYERILLQIHEDEEGKVVRRALEWLLFALVPLQLSQIMEILSVDLGRRVLNRDSRPVHGSALLDALGSLVMYDELTDIVILSHFSVKEYLITEFTHTNRLGYRFRQRDGHTQLALFCMCYLSVFLKQNQHFGVHGVSATYGLDAAVSYPSGTYVPLERSFESHPFLEYVIRCGFRHLTHANLRKTATVLQAIGTLRLVAERNSSQWERFCMESSDFPALEHDFVPYILIAFAPEAFLRSFVRSTKLRLKDGTNPLVYAAYFGKIEHARALLSRGVSLSRRGRHVGSSEQRLPLEVAMERRDPMIVDLFLAEGNSVPHSLFVRALEPRCPFPARNVVKLLQTDEFTDWAVNAQDEGMLLRALDTTRYPIGYPSQQDVDIIHRRLIQIGCDPSARFDETSLRNAARLGHVAVVQQILSLNISFPPSILLDASNSKSSAMIRFLLRNGCNVDVASPTGNTPLHLVMNGFSPSEDERLGCVQALTDAGCNPSTCNQAGDTPFHFAATHGYTPIIQHFVLLHTPFPPDILLAASRSRKPSTIRLLVDKGANVHIIAADGNTPLHIVLNTGVDGGGDHLKCVEMLINAGFDPRLPNADGKTPIDIAAENRHLRIVEYLHSTGALWSPAILLSVAGSPYLDVTPTIKFLVNMGANIHVTTPDGNTPLHLAIKHSWESECLKRIRFLVNAGCDPRARNLAGNTPFHIAGMRGFILVMEYLLSLGISMPLDAMFTQLKGSLPSLSGSCEAVYFLSGKGSDVHTTTESGNTLLHLAATLSPEHDALELTKFLVDAGCNASALNSAQETPLYVAAQCGSISLIEYFLSLDIPLPPDILLPVSKTRIWSNKAQTIRYLIDKGANVFVAMANGDTVLHLLLASGIEEDRLECLKILVAAGCNPLAQNLAGETPLHTAARSGFITILEHLLSQDVPLPPDICLASTPSTFHFLLQKGVGLPTAIKDGAGLVCCTLRTLRSDEDCEAFAGLLVNLGWDFSTQSSAYEAPINVAARRHHILTVKYLRSVNVSIPSDVLLVVVPDNGLHWESGGLPLVRFLIREGANTNTANSNGETPLHLALRCNLINQYKAGRPDHERSWEFVEILLDNGADPSTRNSEGQSPFDIVEEKGQFFKENFLRLVRKSHLIRS